jgi:hypothetical protein
MGSFCLAVGIRSALGSTGRQRRAGVPSPANGRVLAAGRWRGPGQPRSAKQNFTQKDNKSSSLANLRDIQSGFPNGNPVQSLQHKLDAARVQFGKFLRNWRRSNDWSVTTAQDWAKACPALIPWPLRVAGGQWGNLENGKVHQPQPSTFIQLGVLNECLALEDRGPIKDRTLRDRVQRAQPVRHSDGRLWGAEDWFACYIGKLEGPPELWPRQEEIDAESETKRLRTLFDQASELAGVRPVSAAMQVLRKAGDLPMEQVVAIENALFAGERLAPAIVPIARQALDAWVREAAPELISSEAETGAS